MKKILGRIWLVWAGFWFVSLFLLVYPFLWLLLQSSKTYRLAHGLRKIWGRTTSLVAFVWPVVRYEQPLPKNQQLVFCPNHISYLDILTCGSFLPGFNFFMGKIEPVAHTVVWHMVSYIGYRSASREPQGFTQGLCGCVQPNGCFGCQFDYLSRRQNSR